MAESEINNLVLNNSPASTDELIFQKAGGKATKKTTFTDLPFDADGFTINKTTATMEIDLFFLAET